MMHYQGIGYGFMGFGWLFQIFILVLFFIIVWWIVKAGGTFGFKCRENDTPLEILKKRLVRGEISHKEYESLKKEIEKD